MTYGFDPLDPSMANDIPVDAAVLLRSVAPDLTDDERLDILRRTAMSAGSPSIVSAATAGGSGSILLPHPQRRRAMYVPEAVAALDRRMNVPGL
ncbi:hypothetical protein HYG77_33685 (plasmid) [Rhodococcus sp. ZPP]|uniref:hypothetical protein n=1 Tax=Rhodococcus sp. ZPP TaxID=2749906 RepID=UPI001AD85847|nr:hypothetical protein [Rhodococcus sp. ZPP]QTJ70089.1 hypothetical protein HYG77_33685 [Rhodococcus sp. ZPP]